MGDNELEAIRAQRMAQMQSKYGNGGGNDEESKQAQQDQMRQQEEMKHSILSQVLDQQARARLNTLKISKPEKAQLFENMVLRMAQSGQCGRLDDAQFVSILESINAQMPKKQSTVKYDRRRAAIDSDDDDEDYGC